MPQEGRRMVMFTRRRLTAVRTSPWSLAAVAGFATFAVWLVAWRPNASERRIAGDLFPLALELLVVVLAVSCARNGQGRRGRLAWMLVATAFGLYLLGDALWALFELVQDRSPFPSVADGFYLAFYPVLLGGLLLLPGPLRRRN